MQNCKTTETQGPNPTAVSRAKEKSYKVEVCYKIIYFIYLQSITEYSFSFIKNLIWISDQKLIFIFWIAFKGIEIHVYKIYLCAICFTYLNYS